MNARTAPTLMEFALEATARCNLDCRHCSIDLPAGDRAARKNELSVDEIDRYGGAAAAFGAGRCIVTGGEPLLRKDFFDLYKVLHRKGFTLSVATNATLVEGEHIRFFRKYPPGSIEVSVFGATRETYERVSRTPGSFEAFRNGISRLLRSGMPVRLKVMVMRSNKHEIAAMGDFCRTWVKEAYRFDPHLHLRFDRDEARNALIRAERLSPREVVRLERSDAGHFGGIADACAGFAPEEGPPGTPAAAGRRLFRCGAGRRSFVIGPSGLLRPCPALHHPDFLFDLRKGSLGEALNKFLPEALSRETDRPEYLEKCRPCPVAGLCLWCPALAYLETGELDLPVEDFCGVAEARAEGL